MNIKLKRYQRNAALNLRLQPRNMPKVSIICATMRPHLIDDLIAKINAQTIDLYKVVIITQDFSEEDQLRLMEGITKGEVTVTEIPSTDPITLGARHNKSMESIDTGVVAIMDDDDYYGPNYLKGQVHYMIRTNSVLVVKGDAIVTTADHSRTGWIHPYVLGDNDILVGPGGSIVFTKELHTQLGFADVASGYDAIFQNSARMARVRMASSDPFNFAVVRCDAEDHTWKDTKDRLGYGLRINDIDFKDIEL